MVASVVSEVKCSKPFASRSRLTPTPTPTPAPKFSPNPDSNQGAAAAVDAPPGRLVAKDFHELNPTDLPRLDCAHFSPDCTSNSRLRRNDLTGYE